MLEYKVTPARSSPGMGCFPAASSGCETQLRSKDAHLAGEVEEAFRESIDDYLAFVPNVGSRPTARTAAR